MECTVIISEVEEILPRSNGKIPILLEVGRDLGTLISRLSQAVL